MRMACAIMSAATAALLATSSLPAAAQPATPPAQAPCPTPGGGWGGGAMNFLTPEERMMHFAEMQKATAGMSSDQMRAYRMSERDKVAGMTADQRQAYADGLKAKWDALTPAQQAEIQSQMASFRADRPMRGGGGWGHGGGMGQGGCQ